MLSYMCLGKTHGNFRYPNSADGMLAWFDVMERKVLGGSGFESVRLMRPNFTTLCLRAESEAEWTQVMPRVFRAREFSDGIVTDSQKVALAMANADCPAAIVYDEGSQRLGLLHCGFKCLIQPDGAVGIFEEFFAKHGFKKNSIKIRMAYGIGPCCYGMDSLPLLHGNALVKSLPLSTASSGPRAGKESINLFTLMALQLKRLGMREHQIERIAQPRCTACHELGGRAQYHSNVYDGPDGGRNLVVAWMH